jgi:hypothetical protein
MPAAGAGAFLAGFKSPQARRSYRRDLDCRVAFCTAYQLHPYRGLRRTHAEVYLRELEAAATGGPLGRRTRAAELPTPPLPTTNPIDPSTATRPSFSWPQQHDSKTTAADTEWSGRRSHR